MPKSETTSPGSGARMTTSSGSLYFFLQIATSSSPITEGGPIGGYWLPSTGKVFLVTRALGLFTAAVRSRKESEESMDSAGTALKLLDLTLLPMEEESGPNSVPISEAEGRKNLENKRERRKKLPAEREPRKGKAKRGFESRGNVAKLAPFPAKTLDQRVGTLIISLMSPRFKRPQLPETRVSFNRDLFTFKDEASSNLLQNKGVSPEKSRGDEEPVTSQVSDPHMNRTTKLQSCHLQEDRRNYYQISTEHEGTGPYLGYSPTSMTKSRNKGQTVGEKYPDEVSSFFGFCPSQLTPLTWRTLMAIQVLGELHGFSIGVHEILYSYYFSPLAKKDGFYHLRSRDGAPLVEEPSRGVRGNHPFGDGWNSRYVFVKIQEPLGYPTSWRTMVSFAGEAVAKLIMGIPRRFCWVTFLLSREALRHSRVWGTPSLSI
ncbi:BnaAnng04490D [Brassica napus]|uniref:BnaAnng04490D protein n=1 Tax=Brassica napus TaxID=3708 RepID=A0A078HH78_BRANA|nr:BnaAnng04490D [Brassica napus]